MYNDENTSYPGRPPKKFPDKSLHGRVRSAYIPYENLSRAQKFYVNVFDWDMFALPSNVLGRVPDKETSDTPSWLVRTPRSIWLPSAMWTWYPWATAGPPTPSPCASRTAGYWAAAWPTTRVPWWLPCMP